MTNRFMWLAAAALFATTALGAAPAPEVKDDRIHFIPGGVADAEGTKGFMTNDKGGVTALDLETGKVLWESKTAGRPVSVLGGWVWVQTRDKDKANVMRVVGLKLDDGKAATQSDPIVLPDWAAAEEGRGAGRSFSSHAWTNQKDALLLIAWQANTFYWGGAAPSPEVLKARQRHADGVAQVNLVTNEVQMLETAKAPPPPAAPGPKVSAELVKAAARPYGAEGNFVATAGDNAVAVDVEPAGNRQKAVLKRWDLTTEKPLDPIVLAEGGPYQVLTFPSAGVTLVQDMAPVALPTPAEEAAWTVYGLATGKETGRFMADPGATEITVLGPRAYYVARGQIKGPGFGATIPRTLKAVDLKTGKRLWEQPLEGERLPPPPPP